MLGYVTVGPCPRCDEQLTFNIGCVARILGVVGRGGLESPGCISGNGREE